MSKLHCLKKPKTRGFGGWGLNCHTHPTSVLSRFSIAITIKKINAVKHFITEERCMQWQCIRKYIGLYRPSPSERRFFPSTDG